MDENINYDWETPLPPIESGDKSRNKVLLFILRVLGASVVVLVVLALYFKPWQQESSDPNENNYSHEEF